MPTLQEKTLLLQRTTKEEDDGGFLEGELERLFEEGPTEEKDTDDTER